ncbi:MAG: hypothetical protein WD226_00980 [Planctomycetota bacterium]
MSRRVLLFSVLPVVLAAAPSAQRLVGYDLFGFVHEFPSPLANPCLGPSDPTFTFSLGGALGPCILPFGAAGTQLGDIGVDTLNDTYWVTDGFALAEYTSLGVPISAFNGFLGALGPLTGLGVDTAGGLLWATDGFLAQSFFKPATASGCLTVIVPAGLPFPCSLTGLSVTDIEWDPVFGELWCAEGLTVNSFLPSGVLGSFLFWNMSGCGALLGGLEGLGVDTAGVITSSPLPLLYATDRQSIAYDQVGFGPAPLTPKVYPTSVCFPTPGPLNGLSYTARPNHYGSASSCGSAPVLNTVGQSVIGNTTFGFTISGALPGALPFLYYSTTPLCPPFGFSNTAGCLLSLWISPVPPFPPPIPMPPADAFGNSAVTVPLPAAFLGLCRYFQALLITPPIELSEPMEVIVTLP